MTRVESAPFGGAVEGDEGEVLRAEPELSRHFLERGELLPLGINVLLVHLHTHTRSFALAESIRANLRAA